MIYNNMGKMRSVMSFKIMMIQIVAMSVFGVFKSNTLESAAQPAQSRDESVAVIKPTLQQDLLVKYNKLLEIQKAMYTEVTRMSLEYWGCKKLWDDQQKTVSKIANGFKEVFNCNEEKYNYALAEALSTLDHYQDRLNLVTAELSKLHEEQAENREEIQEVLCNLMRAGVHPRGIPGVLSTSWLYVAFGRGYFKPEGCYGSPSIKISF